VVESWDAGFTELEPYRGVNANMHTVEAYLAAADVTGDDAWLDRALRIAQRVVVDLAPQHAWRIPEHFDEAWQPLLDYNADSPADPFRPAGATIGHWLEWSRLALHVVAALEARGRAVPEGLETGARSLFEAAVEEGWSVDGDDGFVYTAPFEGAAPASACTGSSPRRSVRPPRWAGTPARRPTTPGTGCGGSTPRSTSSTRSTVPGCTSCRRPTSRAGPSGRASPTSTTRSRRPSYLACR